MCRRAVYPGTLIIVALALSSLFLLNPHPGTKAQTTTNCCGIDPPTAPRASGSTSRLAACTTILFGSSWRHTRREPSTFARFATLRFPISKGTEFLLALPTVLSTGCVWTTRRSRAGWWSSSSNRAWLLTSTAQPVTVRDLLPKNCTKVGYDIGGLGGRQGDVEAEVHGG